MMSIDLPDQAPLSPRVTSKLPKRPAPCAGLFGWRKDAAPKIHDAGKTPGRDYPAG